nr:MAG TPA: hypothetical protein [Caudoviricetes sp.]
MIHKNQSSFVCTEYINGSEILKVISIPTVLIVQLFLGIDNPDTTAFVFKSQIFLLIISVFSPFRRFALIRLIFCSNSC